MLNAGEGWADIRWGWCSSGETHCCTQLDGLGWEVELWAISRDVDGVDVAMPRDSWYGPVTSP